MSNKNVNVRKSQEITFCLLAGILMFMAMMVAGRAEAGVALGATRVIYPAGQKQVKLAVTNNDENSTYLIQSWVENADGVKDGRFIVTSPLFAMKGKKENTLRILDATNNQLPQDRESLFWMNVKAIPSMDKSKLTENTLQLAIISRIKLYYRPAKLALPPDQAAEKLRFRRSANSLTLINPTPYYLTVTELNAGTRVLENALVPPMGESAVKLPSDAGSNITYRTINDYGALTPKMTGVME
ncbi:TPA: type 1 fimbria chaperone FimC [Escherichia coli]|uniref:type 1 fimbria chaperone FimC n=1 Tax=Escherichia coli TaxID=562 RepID=UPI000DDD8AFA|nr:type 1 fimbria chaperone FimC [Escherichia coli]EFN6652282.1 molecular chaperone FimC [Escherichia coli O166:H6]EFN6737474.1 molecular chaperone FimC [Escherichia coli H6]EEZ4406541.1 type 1 fimbria chaperone FimC [Escherichia coli]EFO1352835.1 molecular chaperone FimC [Escherichia coli]RBL16971.1 molecular chaperone FimC [Escherichia coli]